MFLAKATSLKVYFQISFKQSMWSAIHKKFAMFFFFWTHLRFLIRELITELAKTIQEINNIGF